MKNQPHQQQLAAMMMKTKKRINEKKKNNKNKSNTNQIENENEEAKHFGIDTLRETRRIYTTRYVLIAASVSTAKNVEGAIRFWKERKGFSVPSKVEEEERMKHKCGKSWGCSYHRIGGIFLCEKTGRAHRCGPRCDARILIDDTYVCGISGITSMDDNGTTIVEEDRCTRELAGATADDEFGLENEPNFGERGYILNAFEQGYSCENEKELHDLWWVGYRNGRKSQKRLKKEDEEEERYFV